MASINTSLAEGTTAISNAMYMPWVKPSDSSRAWAKTALLNGATFEGQCWFSDPFTAPSPVPGVENVYSLRPSTGFPTNFVATPYVSGPVAIAYDFKLNPGSIPTGFSTNYNFFADV